MKRIVRAALCALMAIILAGCSQGAKPLTTASEPASRTTPVDFSGDWSPARQFSAELTAKALSDDENPVLSPASAYLCLAMVENGAAGITLDEFKRVMGGDTNDVNALCRGLSENLTATAGSTKLALANSLWADDSRVEVLDSYLQSVTQGYGAEVFSAKLSTDEALEAINGWVNEKTEGLIPVLHEDNYDEGTVLVLLNTIYLDARWKTPFESAFTYDKPFHRADGSVKTVPYLNAFADGMRYISAEGTEGIVLPYDDDKTVFIALRATDGRSARELAAGLEAASLMDYIALAKESFVNFSMPKFTSEYSIYLDDALSAMGLASMFDAGTCDLSALGTCNNGPLFVSQVFQKVKLTVDEEGTEAAAVTEVTMDEGSALPIEEPVELNLDSPFVYAVVDTQSGLPLFFGILDCPA